MRPYCEQALPNDCVSFVVVQACGSCGAFQRSAPTGGAAKGMPFHEYVPWPKSSEPFTSPRCVVFRSGSVPPPPPQAASSSDKPNAAQYAAPLAQGRMFLFFTFSPLGLVCETGF